MTDNQDRGFDSRTMMALLLCMVIWYTWLGVNGGLEPPPTDESGDLVEETSVVSEPVEAPAAPPPIVPIPETDVRTGGFEGCDVALSWTTDGGALGHVQLLTYTSAYEVTPIYYWLWEWITDETEAWNPYGDDPDTEVLLSDTARLMVMGAGSMTAPRTRVEGGDVDDSLEFRGIVDGVVETGLEMRVLPEEETCVFEVVASWRNAGPNTYTGGLWLGAHELLPEYENRFEPVLRPWAMVGDDVETVEPEDIEEPTRVGDDVRWFGFADNYFAFLMMPTASLPNASAWWTSVPVGDEMTHGVHFNVDKPLLAGETYTERFKIYVGPKDLDALGAVSEDLGGIVQLGWFSFFGHGLLWLLKVIQGWVGNWGMAIIGLTVLVKAAFFPLTQMSFKSSQGMQALQPKIKVMREKHKDEPEELNRQMMKLFKENGVNPVAGCLPMLIQMPVWIALYSVLLSSVELYHTEFFYVRDLSAADPYGALPLAVMVFMIAQQQFMPTANMDPAQARMMKLMPVVFGLLFFTFPAGLVLYILVNTTLSVLQQWYIKRTFNTATPETVPAAAQ